MKIYRVVDNKASNDFNKEPEYVVVPYIVIDERLSKPTILVERCGWHGKKYQHLIKKSETVFSEQEAQKICDKKNGIKQ